MEIWNDLLQEPVAAQEKKIALDQSIALLAYGNQMLDLTMDLI
jgi:hypothetical protein